MTAPGLGEHVRRALWRATNDVIGVSAEAGWDLGMIVLDDCALDRDFNREVNRRERALRTGGLPPQEAHERAETEARALDGLDPDAVVARVRPYSDFDNARHDALRRAETFGYFPAPGSAEIDEGVVDFNLQTTVVHATGGAPHHSLKSRATRFGRSWPSSRPPRSLDRGRDRGRRRAAGHGRPGLPGPARQARNAGHPARTGPWRGGPRPRGPVTCGHRGDGVWGSVVTGQRLRFSRPDGATTVARGPARRPALVDVLLGREAARHVEVSPAVFPTQDVGRHRQPGCASVIACSSAVTRGPAARSGSA